MKAKFVKRQLSAVPEIGIVYELLLLSLNSIFVVKDVGFLDEKITSTFNLVVVIPIVIPLGKLHFISIYPSSSKILCLIFKLSYPSLMI